MTELGHFLLTFWHLPVVVLAGWLLVAMLSRTLPLWYPWTAMACCAGVLLLGVGLLVSGSRSVEQPLPWNQSIGYVCFLDGIAGLIVTLLPVLVTVVVRLLSNSSPRSQANP